MNYDPDTSKLYFDHSKTNDEFVVMEDNGHPVAAAKKGAIGTIIMDLFEYVDKNTLMFLRGAAQGVYARRFSVSEDWDWGKQDEDELGRSPWEGRR